jgi:hypothetical protein
MKIFNNGLVIIIEQSIGASIEERKVEHAE